MLWKRNDHKSLVLSSTKSEENLFSSHAFFMREYLHLKDHWPVEFRLNAKLWMLLCYLLFRFPVNFEHFVEHFRFFSIGTWTWYLKQPDGFSHTRILDALDDKTAENWRIFVALLSFVLISSGAKMALGAGAERLLRCWDFCCFSGFTEICHKIESKTKASFAPDVLY